MKKFLMTLSILAVLFPTTSFSKTYISGQLGFSWINSRPNDGSNYRVDAHEGIGSQFYWGYLFPVNDTFSVGPEIGLGWNVFMPSDNAKSQKLLINSTIPIDIKAKIDINQNFYFFGKAGIALVQQDITSSWLFPIGNSSKWQPTFGGGLGYNFNKSLSLELSYTFVNGTNEQTHYKNNTARFQNVSLGVTYSF